MLKLTANDYLTLYDIVFSDDYPGYKPNIIESPNGDGVKDDEKRYAHVAMKYTAGLGISEQAHVLENALKVCHEAALDVAVQLGIPRQFWPDIRYSALRVLEYPPGAGSAKHTDFDLFTLNLYRNKESLLITEQHAGQRWAPEGVHLGEMLQLITGGSIEAAPHEVYPHHHLTQYSLIYFAMPDEAAVLPTGQTCGEWVEERKKRSRYDA